MPGRLDRVAPRVSVPVLQELVVVVIVRVQTPSGSIILTAVPPLCVLYFLKIFFFLFTKFMFSFLSVFKLKSKFYNLTETFLI